MPYTGPGDPRIPGRVKTFWQNVGATPEEKRMWVHIFNSCVRKFGERQEQRCFRMATGSIAKRHRMSEEELTSLLLSSGFEQEDVTGILEVVAKLQEIEEEDAQRLPGQLESAGIEFEEVEK